VTRERRGRLVGILAALALLGGLVLLPSAASAAPPGNDNYASAYRINQPGSTLPRDTGVLNFTTAEATEQGFEAGETCGGYAVGATVHFEVYPDRPGLLRIGMYSSSFLGSVWAWRFTPDDTIKEVDCGIANLTNRIVDFFYPNFSNLTRVQEGQGYNIQVGGLDEDGGGAGGFGSGPFQFEVIFYPDTDRDGWLDINDRCQNLGGRDVDSHNGCPDEDQDGFPEGTGGNDQCPGVKGIAAFQGCPDADGDNFPENGQDHCPGRKGLKYAGCPDSDNDRVPEDGSDKCPQTSALRPGGGLSRVDRDGDGCPDVLHLERVIVVKKRVSGFTWGIRLKYLQVRQVPNGSRVECKVGRRKCPHTPIKNASLAGLASTIAGPAARTGNVPAHASARNIRLLGGRNLRLGTKVEVRITAKYATGEVYRFRVVKGSDGFGFIKEFEGCTNRGSRRVHAKGCK
jgi:hypothetical protein